jgi:hypothetical protein
MGFREHSVGTYVKKETSILEEEEDLKICTLGKLWKKYTMLYQVDGNNG